MMRNVRGLESNKIKQSFSTDSFIWRYNQPIALKEEEDEEKEEAKE